MRKQPLVLALTLAASLLTACGGSGSDPVASEPVPPVQNGVPASATASTMAFSTYVGSLAADETAEPLDIDSAQPPTSDNEEPFDVI